MVRGALCGKFDRRSAWIEHGIDVLESGDFPLQDGAAHLREERPHFQGAFVHSTLLAASASDQWILISPQGPCQLRMFLPVRDANWVQVADVEGFW